MSPPGVDDSSAGTPVSSEPAVSDGSRPIGDSALPTPQTALAIVIASHLGLVVLGSAILLAGGWHKPFPILATFLATVPFWVIAVGGALRFGGLDRSLFAARWFDVPVGVAAGVATQLLAVPAVYWVVSKVTELDSSRLELEARRVVDSAAGGGQVALLVVMVCVAAPIVEELLYRGVLMRSFGQRRPVVGLVASAAIFAALHFQALQFMGLFLFGLVAGGLMLRTGRLAPSMAAHVAFNATTVIGLLAHR